MQTNLLEFAYFYFSESGLTNELQRFQIRMPISRLRFSPPLGPGGRRRRAWTSEDAPPQRLATRVEPHLLRKSCPAIPPRFRPRSRLFWGTKSSDSTDLENLKQRSHGRGASFGDNALILNNKYPRRSADPTPFAHSTATPPLPAGATVLGHDNVTSTCVNLVG